MVQNEASDHIESSGGLIEREQVTSVADGDVAELVYRGGITEGLRSRGVVGRVPDDGLSALVSVISRPGERVDELLIRGSAENDVELSRVDENLIAVHKRRQEGRNGGHPIGDQMELNSGIVVPVGRSTYVDGRTSRCEVEISGIRVGEVGGLQKVEVIAETRHVGEQGTMRPEITVEELIKDVEGSDEFLGLDGLFEALLVLLNLRLLIDRNQAQTEPKIAHTSELDLRINRSITNRNTSQVDMNLGRVVVANHDFVSNGRDVVASIALTSNVEGNLLGLGEDSEELLEQRVKVASNINFVLDEAASILSETPSSTDRVINKDLCHWKKALAQ